MNYHEHYHFESTGLPAVVVSISLGIAAGTGPGIKSYVSETLYEGMIFFFCDSPVANPRFLLYFTVSLFFLFWFNRFIVAVFVVCCCCCFVISLLFFSYLSSNPTWRVLCTCIRKKIIN